MNGARPLCCITYADKTGYNTAGSSLFDAAARAIHWIEVDRKHFGTARRLPDDEILRITVGVRDAKEYRVRVGRVREWLRTQENQNGKNQSE